MKPISYARHRFPPDVIRHAVWLYLRFTLSYRDVEDLLAERGLIVSNEPTGNPAQSLHRWHLDEMVVSLSGRRMYLWRAVDGEGEVLEVLVQTRRDKDGRKLLRRRGFVTTVVVTDKLRSYGAALREIGFSRRHEQGLLANNRAENSHQPVRRRTKDARLQIGQIYSALRFCSFGGLQHIQCSTALDQPYDASTVSNRRASMLA